MNDTPDFIRKKQLEIVLSKPISERFQMGLEMIEFFIQQTRATIRRQHPDYTEAQVSFEFVRRVYPDVFGAEEMERIRQFFLALDQQPPTSPPPAS